VMHFARSIMPARFRAAAMRTRNKMLTDSKPTLEQELRGKLIHIYGEDIKKLQGMMGRDLSAWLK
jgi:hypothetical protein